jgi:hypothetical protein
LSLKETFIPIRTKLTSKNYEGKTAIVGTEMGNAMDTILQVHIDIVHLGGDNKAVYEVMHGINTNIKSQTLQPGWQDGYHGIEMYLQGSGRGVV